MSERCDKCGTDGVWVGYKFVPDYWVQLQELSAECERLKRDHEYGLACMKRERDNWMKKALHYDALLSAASDQAMKEGE